jgi:hypothetical protein
MIQTSHGSRNSNSNANFDICRRKRQDYSRDKTPKRQEEKSAIAIIDEDGLLRVNLQMEGGIREDRKKLNRKTD